MNFRDSNKFVGVILLSGALLSGCADTQGVSSILSTANQTPEGWRPLPGLLELTYVAADGMVEQLKGGGHSREVILPASFVDDRDLERSSAMGRVVAQQIASRFSQSGYSVLEIKLRKSVRLSKGEGQFLLSRELEKVAEIHKATAVLVGSYVESRRYLFVNSQLIHLKDGIVLASQDFRIPLTFELRALLSQSS